MNKERFNMFVNNSIYNTLIPKGQELTKEEWDKGYHYCYDWDGLFIEPNGIESNCCTCHPMNDIKAGISPDQTPEKEGLN